MLSDDLDPMADGALAHDIGALADEVGVWADLTTAGGETTGADAIITAEIAARYPPTAGSRAWVADPVEAATSAEPFERVELADWAGQDDWAEPHDRVEWAEPADGAEATEPPEQPEWTELDNRTEPAQQAGWTEPDDRAELAQQAGWTEPDEATEEAAGRMPASDDTAVEHDRPPTDSDGPPDATDHWTTDPTGSEAASADATTGAPAVTTASTPVTSAASAATERANTPPTMSGMDTDGTPAEAEEGMAAGTMTRDRSWRTGSLAPVTEALGTGALGTGAGPVAARGDGFPVWPQGGYPPVPPGVAESPMARDDVAWPAAPLRVGRPSPADPSTAQPRTPAVKQPRRPAVGLAALLVFALLGGFFGWVSADPFWLSVGHAERGTATVSRCAGSGLTARCVGTFRSPSFARDRVAITALPRQAQRPGVRYRRGWSRRADGSRTPAVRPY